MYISNKQAMGMCRYGYRHLNQHTLEDKVIGLTQWLTRDYIFLETNQQQFPRTMTLDPWPTTIRPSLPAQSLMILLLLLILLVSIITICCFSLSAADALVMLCRGVMDV